MNRAAAPNVPAATERPDPAADADGLRMAAKALWRAAAQLDRGGYGLAQRHFRIGDFLCYRQAEKIAALVPSDEEPKR